MVDDEDGVIVHLLVESVRWQRRASSRPLQRLVVAVEMSSAEKFGFKLPLFIEKL
jgi:hypothetical protein